MYAQIIFFIALALFLILLVRRFASTPQVIEQAGHLALDLTRRIGRFGSQVSIRVAEQAKKVKGNIPLLADRPVATPGVTGEHQFWQEEVSGEAVEVAGLFEEGDEFFRQGNYDASEEFFLKAATRSPSDARVYARLGVIYLHQKNFNDAIESLKVAVKLDKYNPSRHYNLALAYLGNDDRQKATVSAREAITLDPVTKKYRQLLDHLLERK
ncbi:MAG: designed protein CTPR3 [Berkelbacteria bacterium GW2011_GWA2_46_7]|uniref:Designed protein CTPR3 n=1 Tax=Berkelbacteria bacterium GW2011_GWA2_46_7 TaxID=1618335 RepID=A0A0G1QI98_9BACT|nr:MAG: designed protein CTPR3 [Berkelbacteria bacterium GW2011_GWA2_46_7]